ncbi:MAG: phosphodiester glycosidase family protein [Alicyclobacillus sp.]|nr:phosphodiester glycosidase family protein [Alicyclobacillus sp.]
MHGYLLRPLSLYTLSEAEIRKDTPQLMATAKVTGSSQHQIHQDFSDVSSSQITLEKYTGTMFTANVMLIRDPKRVEVAVTKYNGNVGQTVSDMVKEYHAIAGVNGGAFRDTGWQGTGGLPQGITISNGQVITGQPSGNEPVIALTKKGALIVGPYSLTQLEQMGVDQAVTFGPVLVQDGKDMIQGDGGWGYAPRTAIGQTADGTIILAVTDGRYIHGPNNMGASLQDMAQLMLHYGAVVAANLDGGSSTTMVYKGKLVNQPSDVLGEREVATSVIVK